MATNRERRPAGRLTRREAARTAQTVAGRAPLKLKPFASLRRCYSDPCLAQTLDVTGWCR